MNFTIIRKPKIIHKIIKTLSRILNSDVGWPGNLDSDTYHYYTLGIMFAPDTSPRFQGQ